MELEESYILEYLLIKHRYGGILNKLMNDVSSRLVDSGVFQKVNKDILHALIIDVQREIIHEAVFVLSISHLQGAFYNRRNVLIYPVYFGVDILQVCARIVLL